LPALRGADFGNFSVDNHIGYTNEQTTDSRKIYNAIKENLDRSDVSPQEKKINY
jgi:hypothetical protein